MQALFRQFLMLQIIKNDGKYAYSAALLQHRYLSDATLEKYCY